MPQPKLLQVGSRVELHPATDRWMMGDRYGTITAKRIQVVGRATSAPAHTEYRVKLDVSGKSFWMHEDNILHEGNDEHEALAKAST